jgi:hypothetical protein
MAPQFSNDYWDWACYYLFSYLATQGIATFTVKHIATFTATCSGS